MLIGITGALAIVPSLLLVWFFVSRDEHPEPSGVLWATFWLGVLSILPTLLVAFPADMFMESVLTDTVALAASDAFVGAAFPEELFKLAVLVFYASRHRAFDEPMDGIVYGVVASLGFATFENLIYSAQGGVGVTIMRAFTAVPMHAFCGVVMGYYVGRARFPGEVPTTAPWLKAYLIPVVFHGVYDMPLLWFKRISEGAEELSDGQTLAGLGAMAVAISTLIVLVVVGLLLVRKLRREQLELVQAGRFVLVDDDVPAVPVATLAPNTPAQAVPRSQREHSPNPALAAVLIVGGLLSASFGGLVLLGCLAAFAGGEVKPDEVLNMVVGGAVLSVPPLGLGLLLFVLGLRKLPRTHRRRSPYAR
jgi:protease PrsW